MAGAGVFSAAGVSFTAAGVSFSAGGVSCATAAASFRGGDAFFPAGGVLTGAGDPAAGTALTAYGGCGVSAGAGVFFSAVFFFAGSAGLRAITNLPFTSSRFPLRRDCCMNTFRCKGTVNFHFPYYSKDCSAKQENTVSKMDFCCTATKKPSYFHQHALSAPVAKGVRRSKRRTRKRKCKD